jgi:hypothetical protein
LSHVDDFSSFLNVDFISAIIEELGLEFRDRIFTPFVTIFAFLAQIFSDDKSCRQAVWQLVVTRVANNKKPCSVNTGAFCKAKARLPLELISQIAKKLATSALEKSDVSWNWPHGDVKVVDGTGLSMPDSEANRKVFPSHLTHQKTGFPGARLLGVFSLATGVLIDMAIAPSKGKGTGELTLLSKMWHCFKPNDTILGDSLFSTYWVVAHALTCHLHVVAELRKKSVWRINPKLSDQIITIKKSCEKPLGLSKKEFSALPMEIQVRVITLICAPKGFRPNKKFILTTHLDSTVVTAEHISELYKRRWQVELNLRSIKITLGMDVLRGKTPQMVLKEIWITMLTYNLIRLKMIEVGKHCKKIPNQISFRATQQVLELIRKARAFGGTIAMDVERQILDLLATQTVGNRPDRYEPRAIKRRPKNYYLLKESRAKARKLLCKKYKSKPSC